MSGSAFQSLMVCGGGGGGRKLHLYNGDLKYRKMMNPTASYHWDKVFVQQYESAVFHPFLEEFSLQMFKSASHALSFIFVVSCYKSSGSFLNFFELILKAYT